MVNKLITIDEITGFNLSVRVRDKMQQVLNKSDFITNISDDCDEINAVVVDEAVRELIGLMIDTLVNDGRVEVRGFGSFSLHHRKERIARNPKTGEKVKVSAKAIPHFKPGKALREAVNEKYLSSELC